MFSNNKADGNDCIVHFAGHKCDSITSFLSFHQFNSIKDRAKQLAQINKYPEKEIAAEIIAKYCSSDAEADDSSSSNNITTTSENK